MQLLATLLESRALDGSMFTDTSSEPGIACALGKGWINMFRVNECISRPVHVGSLGSELARGVVGTIFRKERRRGNNQICRHHLIEEVSLKQKTMDYVWGNVASCGTPVITSVCCILFFLQGLGISSLRGKETGLDGKDPKEGRSWRDCITHYTREREKKPRRQTRRQEDGRLLSLYQREETKDVTVGS